MALKITNENFETEVLKSDIPVLADFWSTRCGPCLAMGPVIDELAAELEGKVKVVKVNVDENYPLAAKYNIEFIPTFILFRDGAPETTAVGGMAKQTLKSKLNIA